MSEEPFEYVAMPYTDSASLFDWDQEYGFTDQGRWGWQRELFGHVISAKRGTYADLLLFGDGNNSPVESIMAFETASPSPCFEWAAAYAAKTQRAFINDPARPLQSLSLNQIKVAPTHQRFDFIDINSLASHGLAIQKVGADNQPMIAREQTSYQLNLYGQPDDAYELMTTLATLAKLLRNQKAGDHLQIPAPQAGERWHQLRPGPGDRHARHRQGRTDRAIPAGYVRRPGRGPRELQAASAGRAQSQRSEPARRPVSAGRDQPAAATLRAGSVPAAIRPRHR
jgi:hypothetical protein